MITARRIATAMPAFAPVLRDVTCKIWGGFEAVGDEEEVVVA